jgi:hypothetical protein
VKDRLTIFIILSILSNIFAMSEREHDRHIKEAFGNSVMDYGNVMFYLADDKYAPPSVLQIKTKVGGKRKSMDSPGGAHRVVFHWGWNIRAKDHLALQEYLRSKLKCSDLQIRSFNKCVNVEWTKRKFKASSQFHINYKRFSARKLAPIAYDIHILGDHIFKKGGAEQSGITYMRSEREMITDLQRHTAKLKGSEQLVKELRKCRKASDALELLNKKLPAIVDKNFPKKKS